MQTFSDRVADKSKELMKKYIDDQLDTLSAGMIIDFPAYKYISGQIGGMKVALELVDEAVAHVTKEAA